MPFARKIQLHRRCQALFDDGEIRATLKKAVIEFSRTQPLDEALWSDFENRISYQTVSFEEDEGV